MKTCMIFASGQIKDPMAFTGAAKASDLLICADGGAGHLRKMGITPHIIVGDMDSIDAEDRQFFETKPVRFIRHPQKKDATDTELAVMLAIKEEADDITLVGGSGSRLDHTLANIFLMKKIADHKINGRMIDGHNEVIIITGQVKLTGTPGELLSVLPASLEVTGVTMTGVEYPLENARICMGESIGISNQFVEKEVIIKIKSGVLIGFKSKD